MTEYLLTNFLNGIIAISLLIGAYSLFDLTTYRIDFYEELQENNYSVAIMLAAFFLGLSFIIASAAY